MVNYFFSFEHRFLMTSLGQISGCTRLVLSHGTIVWHQIQPIKQLLLD